MKKSNGLGSALAGAAAGSLNGFFGGTGGTVLVPLLEKTTDLPQQDLFPCSIRIMLPICLVSLLLTPGPLPLKPALPYLLGSLAGGLCSLGLRRRVKSIWLHRGLGLLLILGGVRLLWS